MPPRWIRQVATASVLVALAAGDFTLLAAQPAPNQSSDAPPSDPLPALRSRIQTTLAKYVDRRPNTRDQNCWEMMHWIIAYGVGAQASRSEPGGEPVNAIGWLCYGGACRGQALLYVEQGRVAARKGPNVQGHYGQFLAILAQSKVKSDYGIQLEGRWFTVADLIESEKLGCRSGIELTFKLIALAHYLDLNTTWKNDAGQEWSIPRLIREEIEAPIRGAACGGTHRLMGLSYAVRARQKHGQPIDGEYLRAQTYLADYHRYTFGLQNADGSFSTEWFARRGARPDLDRRLQTTGHILEWLVYSVPPESLHDPRLVKAVEYLTGILAANPQRNWEIGPLGHALHSLVLYDERLAKESPNRVPLAGQERSGAPRDSRQPRPKPAVKNAPPSASVRFR